MKKLMSLAVAGVLATTASAVPAQADPFGQGFSVTVTATPLRIEVFEPSIPIPTDPQFELGFSYTRVLGESGPSVTARSSAMWPGPAVGEGLKTFGEQLGLPAALTGGQLDAGAFRAAVDRVTRLRTTLS